MNITEYLQICHQYRLALSKAGLGYPTIARFDKGYITLEFDNLLFGKGLLSLIEVNNKLKVNLLLTSTTDEVFCDVSLNNTNEVDSHVKEWEKVYLSGWDE